MKQFIEAYHEHKDKVEGFLQETLMNIETCSSNYDKLFDTFRSLELIYEVDCESGNQISDNIFFKKRDPSERGKTRKYLLDKISIKDNGYGFSSAYKSNTTNHLCVSAIKKEGNLLIFMDFDLELLLERLGIIEKHAIFNKFEKTFYIIAGFFMMGISFSALAYAGYDFFINVANSSLNIHNIFKPIVSATLGLAVFDLSKTILEQEVFFKTYSKNQDNENRVLTKFLFTILIALGIETLMVVFKSAMEKDGDMINGLYLMTGISLIIASLSLFIKNTKKQGG